MYGLWWLAGLRGLRRGELVGLRWVDVDLANATLTVTRALVELPGVVAESEPKTAAGNRTITLDPATVTVLADHRRRQQRMYDDHGTAAGDTGFVFAWPDGRPIRPGWLTHRFTARAGVRLLVAQATRLVPGALAYHAPPVRSVG
ncbi:hypothetical protein ACIA5D_13455 [Actinoplanes sp. NPDC051513]|uniref:hypothetical protein n=1 Tax=Actinoplanes sp. NPDC051513 TaxID=3363908 RepID=UPI003794FEC0